MAFAALRTPRKAAVNLNLNAFSARAVLLAVVCNLLSGGGDGWLGGGVVIAAGGRVGMGRLDDRRVSEASGLVASKRNPGILWTHNDSGDRARVFAVRASDGNVVHELTVSGAGSADWEDMALNPAGQLCAGDVGNNAKGRRTVTIYCIDEPNVNRKTKYKSYSSTSATPYKLRYPDGGQHNAETLIIDPRTNMWCVVTKGGERHSEVFAITGPKPWRTTDLTFMRKIRTYGGWAGPVGGDISWDGNTVVLKSYGYYFYVFTRRAFFEGGQPDVVGVDYDPAEAMAFAAGSRSMVYTLSEGQGAPLYRYQL